MHHIMELIIVQAVASGNWVRGGSDPKASVLIVVGSVDIQLAESERHHERHAPPSRQPL